MLRKPCKVRIGIRGKRSVVAVVDHRPGLGESHAEVTRQVVAAANEAYPDQPVTVIGWVWLDAKGKPIK